MNAPTSLLHPLRAQVLSFEEDEHDYHFQVEYPDPPACHTCGTVGQLVRFGKKQVKYRDVPMHGKRVSLWAVQRRFQCKSCDSTFTPKFHEMAEDHRMTRRCYDFIVKRSLANTNASVAHEVGVDESVVRAVIKAYCEVQAYGYRPTLPRVLGIDELYLNRQFRCVLTNIEQGTIIDILESRQFDVLYNYLANMRGRENVQIVCQDMWKPYRDVASKLFPKAAIVVDRFHIQRMANESLEVLRKGIKKELTQHQRRQLKGDRKLLLMRRRDLNPMNELVIHTWLDQFPELGVAYKLKEAFFDIWESSTEAEARSRYQQWLSMIPEGHKAHWKPLITSMTNWEREIFAYFGPAQRNTNAFTESINRQMRDLNRNARGMSFEMFRAKTLFSLEHKVIKPKPKRQSPFVMRDIFTMDPSEIPTDYGVPIEAILKATQGAQ
ncbi:ISL3 family transposase [Pseudomonas entomophila]|uniref:ISL3 family transposase n=1 Tax=Pseudomonas entomophila TaxID=312306 RepID=UPI0023D7F00D|nr:ISL3 family transposase [Pseudomonas entomophila]MDF0729118.1 ISL3 family transposase [Pseudomonas entomophila]MDF0729238.1 ISL3 family transposase [Pseudomonas entomophila]MDF0731047.1 ISL3 family transposase [Pseudomonas entomophila]MDF0733573.1 ISL3 family transposase [Pseudomonas entomophila]